MPPCSRPRVQPATEKKPRPAEILVPLSNGFAEEGSPDSTSASDTSVLQSDPSSCAGKRSLPGDPSSDEHAVGQPSGTKKPRMSEEERVSTIASAVSTILDCIGEDRLRQGLEKTPIRYAKALLALTDGYNKSIEDVMGDAEFDENHSEMVLIRNINVYSLCEHHILPFYGVCHVAYIPSGPVIGLSKIARIVDLFARRLQVQERLTSQVADAVQEATSAVGVMVYVSCSHMCMSMRGIQKVGTQTITTAARGRYKTDGELRREFLSVLPGVATL